MSAAVERIGHRPDVLEQATVTKPGNCLCSWSVVRPGPGTESISRRTWAHSGCPARFDHQQQLARRGAA